MDPRAPGSKAGLRAALPLLVSLLALGWTLSGLDWTVLSDAVAGADRRWLLAAALLGPVQVLLGALRWWLIADAVGAPLQPRQAAAEYYLSTFLNQVLPGGVAGDAVRVWRHGREGDGFGPAVRAALLDRGAGQVALAAVAGAGLLAWPVLHPDTSPPAWGVAAVVAVLAAGAALALWPWGPPSVAALRGDLRRSLLAPGLRWLQALLSLMLTGSFLLGFALVALSLGLEPGGVVFTAVPLVLVAMALPLSVGGWGIRELAVASLFGLLGRPQELGVALSGLYGLTVLAGALPGALALANRERLKATWGAVAANPATAIIAAVALNWMLLLPRILARPERFTPLPLPEPGDTLWRFFIWRDSEDLFRFVFEHLVLLTAAALTRGRWSRLLAAAWGLLLLVQINEAVGLTLMNQRPLLYDELFLLQHAAVLASDLWRPGDGWRLAAAAAALALLGGLVVRLWRLIGEAFQRPARPLWALLGLGWAFAMTTAWIQGVDFGWMRTSRWVTPDLVENIAESAALYEEVQQVVAEDHYADLAQLPLRRSADVHVFVVESYGRVLADHPELSPGYRARLEELSAALGDAGWAQASATDVAPVSGGRSWLADASLLLGMHIQYESQYQHVIEQIDRLPSMVSWFADRGYHTVLIAPKDRARPGVRLNNHFAYETTVFFADLEYAGPEYGWGWIPDEYSLLYADERWFAPSERPIFSFFHMVSSHAPWEVVPPRVDDWRDFEPSGSALTDDAAAAEEIQKRLKRYHRGEAETRYMGELDGLAADAYAATVDYDLDLITDYILRRGDPDDLFIVMGDHQPPVLDVWNESFEVPVHVITRDAALLEALGAYGFTPGLWPVSDAEPLRHEGLFSLLARELARAWSSLDAAELPAWRPGGAADPAE